MASVIVRIWHLTMKLTCPAAIPMCLTDTRPATGNKGRGRVRCSAGLGPLTEPCDPRTSALRRPTRTHQLRDADAETNQMASAAPGSAEAFGVYGIRASIASRASSAPSDNDMPPAGVPASRGLTRISICPRASHSSRTVGTPNPAPNSTATSNRPATRSSQAVYRMSCSDHRASSQTQSLNIKMFGRATAPQRGQAGNSDRARIVVSSTSTCTSRDVQIPMPHPCVHWR